MNLRLRQWLPVTQDYLVSVATPVFSKQTRPMNDHPSNVLVQQGFETQGWQPTSDNQRKKILKNFKSKFKAKKFLRNLHACSGECKLHERSVYFCLKSASLQQEQEERKRSQTPPLKSLFIDHHLALLKHDRIIQLGRHGWYINPLLESVWFLKLSSQNPIFLKKE